MIRLVVFIVCLFVILYHFREVEKETENFVGGLHQFRVEHFEEEIPSVNDMKVNNNVKPATEDSYEKPINNTPKNETAVNNNNGGNAVNNNNGGNSVNNKAEQPVCQSKSKNDKTGDCMFGCPEEKKEEPVKPKKTDFNEMIMTLEETEKICDLIEEKDRARKEKEDHESLKKQVELNKKFLIQQKAQDKQIKDLEALVKSMTFTHEMNEAAVAKCGKHHDECLSDKEKNLKELLLEKQRQTKQVKININFKDFGKEFLSHLMNKLGLNSSEMQNLLDAINSGALNLDELKNQVGFNNGNFNRLSDSDFMDDSECPQCKVDLSEYIDRCKIPCYKCRDPKWKCPQDIRK